MPVQRIELIANVSQALEQIRDLNDKIRGLELYKSLTKSGAKWEGDVLSKKWSEYLAVPRDVENEVTQCLGNWDDEGQTLYQVVVVDGHLCGVWIA